MQYPTDKQGRSVKQLALLKQFAHDSFIDLPKEGAHAYAELIYDRIEKADAEEREALLVQAGRLPDVPG